MAAARVVVVGLGPAGVDLLLPAAHTVIDRIPRRFVRTRRHPALVALEAEGYPFHSFDDLYETAPDLAAVYAAIVDALVEAAVAEGEVLYAVPGNPAVAEHPLSCCAKRRARGAIDLTVIPGLSFVELAWARGVDPMSGVQVVDGRGDCRPCRRVCRGVGVDRAMRHARGAVRREARAARHDDGRRAGHGVAAARTS